RSTTVPAVASVRGAALRSVHESRQRSRLLEQVGGAAARAADAFGVALGDRPDLVELRDDPGSALRVLLIALGDAADLARRGFSGLRHLLHRAGLLCRRPGGL